MANEPDNIEQQEEEDLDAEEGLYPPLATTEQDITQLEIDVKEDPFQVSAIIQKIDRKQLILAPDFQRKEVWDIKRRSEFIESILLNYPLPPLYLNQDRSGRYIVVDGLQRSSSVYRFVKNEFALKGLERLTWLNGLHFSSLGPELQSRIEDRKLLCYVLRPSVPLYVVYDIFARINRGGIPLNRQEIRHGLHQGKSTVLLRKLANTRAFADWIGHQLQHRRMRDEEAVLRCIGFARVDPEKDYRGDMDQFLESVMLQLNSATDDAITKIEQTFERVFILTKAFLGESAFRIPTEMTKGRINIAVMESIYRFFASHSEEWLRKNAKQIKANYDKLIASPEFRNEVRFSTSTTSKVRSRFGMARNILGDGCAD